MQSLSLACTNSKIFRVLHLNSVAVFGLPSRFFPFLFTARLPCGHFPAYLISFEIYVFPWSFEFEGSKSKLSLYAFHGIFVNMWRIPWFLRISGFVLKAFELFIEKFIRTKINQHEFYFKKKTHKCLLIPRILFSTFVN